MRKIFLENLITKKGIGKNKNKQVIDWENNINNKIKFIYDNIEGNVEIVKYDNINKNLWIKYKNEEPFKIFTGNFKDCKLGKLLGQYTNEFKIEVGHAFKDGKRDIIITDKKYKNKETKPDKKGIIRITNQKLYKYKCNKCGYEGWIIEHSLLTGKHGCACCCQASQIVVEDINSIVAKEETHWMIPYFQGGYDEAKIYTKSSGKKVFFKCPICNKVKDKKVSIDSLYHNHGINCSCSDGQSYPSKLMYSILEQLEIEFETEYSPKWIGRKRYDFYFKLNNKKYIIEIDGIWHKEDNLLSGITKEESQLRDNYKDEMANKHGITVIRIDCEKSDLKYIKNNIVKKLGNMFDLSNINWLKCEEFALSSLVKDVCNLKKNNKNISIKEIKNIVRLGETTIRKYLTQGTKLGWCNYDPKEEAQKGRSKSGKFNGKKVEILKNNISLGIFDSCAELQRRSEEIFNIKLLKSNISEVCRGEKKLYKGYCFKYI